MVIMRSTFFRYVMAAGATLALAACSDSSTGPGAAPSRAVSPQTSAAFERSEAASHAYEFRLTENGTRYDFGVFSLYVPSDAVCRPGSDHGIGALTNRCATLDDDQSIRVSATVSKSATGGYSINFSPSVTFRADKNVILSTSAFASELNGATGPKAPDQFSFASLGPAHAGPTLVSYLGTGGTVWARIYHFSGYVIGGGDNCDPANPPC